MFFNMFTITCKFILNEVKFNDSQSLEYVWKVEWQAFILDFLLLKE